MAQPKRRPSKASRRPRMLRLLPLTVTMLSLLLIIKANELYFDSRKIRELYAVRSAVAEEKKEASHGEEKKEEKKDSGHADGKKDEKAADHAEEKKDAKKEESHGEEAKKEEGQGDAKKEENPAEHGDEKKDEKKDAEHGDEKKGDEKKDEGGHGEKSEEGGHGGAEKPVEEERTHGTGKSTVKEIEAQKAKVAQPLYSKTELDLLQNLSKRREELDAREREVELKSKVLEATEKRIGDRMVEMKTMEGELQRVLAQYNEKQNEQLKSLVKIYENMKPDEAAAIFNEMEMPILLEVIGKMSERKVAPVLANMSPKKAKDVTQELAEKRKKAANMAAGNPATPAVAPAPAAAAATPAKP